MTELWKKHYQVVRNTSIQKFMTGNKSYLSKNLYALCEYLNLQKIQTHSFASFSKSKQPLTFSGNRQGTVHKGGNQDENAHNFKDIWEVKAKLV